MRIVLSVDALSPQLTGIGRYVWELAQGLPNDHRVTQFRCYRDARVCAAPPDLLGRQKMSKLARLLRGGRFKNRSALRNSMFHGPNFFLPDEVESGIITVHDLSVFKYPETHPAERIRHFEEKFQSALVRAKHILTDCEHGRQELIDWFSLPAECVTAVPLGVSRKYTPTPWLENSEALGRYGIESSGFILCVATYEPRKRVAAAIAAHALLCERWSQGSAPPPLVLAGASGWMNAELTEAIQTGTQMGRVLSLGYVAESDLPRLYASAGLFLFPSIYEGFGLPPLEAMASGVPTIVANSSCLPEVTKGAAMFIDPDDIEGFSFAIERGLVDRGWRARAVEAGRTVAASYSWERCIQQTVDVYEKIWPEIA